MLCVCFAALARADDSSVTPPAPATRPAKTKAKLPPVPPKSSSEILEMILSPDAATRVAVRRYSLRGQIPRDLANPDTDVQQQAVRTLEKVSLHELSDPLGVRIISDEPSWCRRNLKPAIAHRLIELKQYDLIRDMAAMALSDGRDSAGIDDAQAALLKMLLASGKFDQAVPAAKTYFNACALGQTSAATSLMAEALLNGPGQKDPAIVQRFKAQQAAGAQIPAADSAPAPSAGLGENILKSIPIDPAPYQAELDKLAAVAKNYDTLIQRGNLLLLQDKGADAVSLFQMAADISSDPKQASEAISGVARAMRARDGSVGNANAYILSLRQAAEPKTPTAAQASGKD
jgi:hypothetical protein